ncbi:hypothetical protein [Campylobacter majalis]
MVLVRIKMSSSYLKDILSNIVKMSFSSAMFGLNLFAHIKL